MRKKTYNEVKEYIEKEEYKLLSEKYIDRDENLKLQCPKGHIFEISWNSFKQGTRCPDCLIEKMRISREELVNSLNKYYDKNGVHPSTKDFRSNKGLYGYNVYIREFGSIIKAFESTNIPITTQLKRKFFDHHYSHQELIDLLLKYYEEVGFPTSRGVKKTDWIPTDETYRSNFGSFKNAILISGIEIPKNRKRFFDRENLSNEDMLSLLKYYTDEKLKNNTYLLTLNDIDNIKNMPHSSTYNIRFGGIVEAYKLLNINYKEFNNLALENNMKEKYILLKEDLGHTPNSREIDKASLSGVYYSMSAYENHFESLTKLQRFMGYVPTVSGFLNNINRLYLTPNGNIALSSYEYVFLLMMETHNIDFSKEDCYKEYIPNFNKRYRFDFIISINNKNYFIEIFGITANEKYDKKSLEKIQLCKNNNIPLITFYPDDFWNNNQEELYDMLLNKILDIDEEYYDKENNKIS